MSDNNFKQPLQKYRGCDLWMLNDELDDKELEFQIEEMKDKGFGCVIARTYNGLKSDYPGEDFMHKMDVIINKAKEVGLQIVLQAAYMPKACVGLSKEETLGVIECKKDTEEILSDEELIASYEGINYVFRLIEGSLNMFGKGAVKRYIKRSYQDAWMKYSHEFGKTIRSIWVDEPRYDSYHIPWFKELPELFMEKYGYDICKNVHMLYVNTGDYKKLRYDFWTLLRDLMGENYFKQIRQWCDKNGIGFSGHLMGEDTLKSQIEDATANMPYYKYFDTPGIDVLKVYANKKTDEIKNYKDERLWFPKYTTPLQCVSAAYQAGKEDILAELYGCSTESVSFRDQKYYFDHFAALGINHRCAHAVFYSLNGFRKRFYPPHINYYQPYWSKYKVMTDCVARTSAFVSKGKPVSDLLVIHPLETAYCIKQGAHNRSEITYSADLYPTHTIDRYDFKLYKLTTDLIATQNYFHFGDLLTILEDGKVEGDKFIIGKMSYTTVVLPYLEVVSADLLCKLQEYTFNGGKLIVLGNVPDRIDGTYDDTLQSKILSMKNTCFVKELSQLISMLDSDRGYRLMGEATEDILVNYRCDDDKKYFFILNDNCSRENTVHMEINGEYTARVYDATTGEISLYPVKYSDNNTYVECHLMGAQSVMIELEAGKTCELKTYSKRKTVIDIDGKWDITSYNDNVINLEFARFSKDGKEYSKEYTILAIQSILASEEYKGEIYLKYNFQADDQIDNLTLAVEKPEQQEFYLNGKKIDNTVTGYYFSKGFKTINLGTCQKGDNEIIIKREFFCPAPREMNLFDLFMTKPKVELESIYVTGDFSVDSNVENSRFNGDVKLSKDFVLSSSKKESCFGDITSSGYPFYAGSISLSKDVEISEQDLAKTVSLKIGTAHFEMCEVIVNGKNAGELSWEPYTLDITSHLKNGKNKIELKFYTTLRNLLGPSHNPRGEVGLQSPVQFVGHYDEPDWYNWADVDSKDWTNSYNLMHLGVYGVSLEIV